VPVIRVLGLTLIISGVKNVQQAYVSKTMQFRRFFFATLGGTIFSAVVGIAMAYMGYGVWALVMQQVLNAGVNTAILWLTVGWKPKLIFSIKRLGGLISYGWKLLASALLDTVYNKLYQLVVGIFYSSSDLAYYNKADQLPLLVVENINSSIDSVLLPVLSKEQDKRDTVREMTRRAIKISTYVMMPMMAGLAACAEPLVRLLLTEKWVPCVPYMQIFCVCYAFYPLHTANLNAIKAMGRSDLFLILEIIKKAVGITALLITMRMGVIYMALSRIFTGVLAQIINAYPNSKLLKYPYLQQLKDMLPAILLSTLMGFAVYSLNFLGLGDVVTLGLQILFGIAIYAVGSIVFKLDSFSYILNIIKNILHRGAAKD
jgi:O-antigen/teichoic acid export membrane protein